MRHGLTGIDHLLVGVSDLDAASAGWQRLGFTLAPRGRHFGWGTANACVMFADDYLELLGLVDPSLPSNGLDRFLAAGDGGLGLALAADDLDLTARSFVAAGLGAGTVEALARQIELPEDSVLARFRLMRPDPAVVPGVSAFFCQHLTPALLRQPGWLAHANGATGLAGVTIQHEAPASLVEPWERLAGSGAVTATDSVVTVHLGRHRLTFASRDDLELLHPELDWEQSRPGRVVLASLSVSDIDQTLDHLIRWQIDHIDRDEEGLVIPAEEANGIALAFLPGRS